MEVGAGMTIKFAVAGFLCLASGLVSHMRDIVTVKNKKQKNNTPTITLRFRKIGITLLLLRLISCFILSFDDDFPFKNLKHRSNNNLIIPFAF